MRSPSASPVHYTAQSDRLYNGLFWLSLLFSLSWLLRNLWLNEVPPDSGDGVTHYFIAKSAWQQPQLFLDHWGKPFFTLFSSPFAQGGFKVFIGFNLLVFVLTVLVARKTLHALNLARTSVLESLFPLILLATPDYSFTLLAGLTEPFFNLLILVLVWLLSKKKFFWFAMLAGALPFARSEGQLVLILAFITLMGFRQWRYIPVLAVIGLCYSAIGAMIFDDLLWYINHNPYTGAADIYHHGTWNHYIVTWRHHMGWGGGFLLFSVVFTWWIKPFRDNNWAHWFALLIWFGILSVHGFLWFHGDKGALGLTRLATQGWPAAVLAMLSLWHNGFLDTRFAYMRKVMVLIVLVLTLVTIAKLPYPTRAEAFEHSLNRAASWVRSNQRLGNRVYYYHPALAFWSGHSLADTTSNWHQLTYHTIKKRSGILQAGDLLVVDSHFEKMEMGIPEQLPDEWKKVRRFAAFSSNTSHLGLFYYVDVYQYQPHNEWIVKETSLLTIPKPDGAWPNPALGNWNHEFVISPSERELYLKVVWEFADKNLDYSRCNFVLQTTTKWEHLSYALQPSGIVYIPLTSTDTGYKFSLDTSQDFDLVFERLEANVVEITRNPLIYP
jgi:hypothetical protein